jgi:shikimate dehydrogenase
MERTMSRDNAERERLGSPVDAHTRLFAILGYPIAHVRAPVVWSALFRRFGLNAVFLPAEVAPVALDAALAGWKATKNVDGLMFTMPHKVAAMRHADRISERARRVGSINLLRPEADGSWSGDNVDGAGFVAGLAADGVDLAGRHAYVHGAGGVGENIAWSLAAEPVASLTVFDIDTVRAQALATRIGAVCGIDAKAGPLDPARCGLAVNASPVGLNAADPLPFAVEALASTCVVADVIMEPLRTRLLDTAERRGLKVHHGRHMMNHGMPLAAAFFGLPTHHDWNGGALQNRGWQEITQD